MDNQQFFTECVARLVAQGQPSMKNQSCMYRGDNGTMCAVGVFIPDDEFAATPEESCSVTFAVKKNYWPTITALAQSSNILLMQSMQSCHDGFGSYRNPEGEDEYFDGEQEQAADDPNWVENFKSRAAQVAQTWGLKA